MSWGKVVEPLSLDVSIRTKTYEQEVMFCASCGGEIYWHHSVEVREFQGRKNVTAAPVMCMGCGRVAICMYED